MFRNHLVWLKEELVFSLQSVIDVFNFYKNALENEPTARIVNGKGKTAEQYSVFVEGIN